MPNLNADSEVLALEKAAFLSEDEQLQVAICRPLRSRTIGPLGVSDAGAFVVERVFSRFTGSVRNHKSGSVINRVREFTNDFQDRSDLRQISRIIRPSA